MLWWVLGWEVVVKVEVFKKIEKLQKKACILGKGVVL